MNGQSVVNYTYDAWGKITSITGSMADSIGNLNPMCYRGYYFDIESGYYYLQSRYYDSNTCRFINADESSVLELTKGTAVGHNLFAYCYNNPVNNVDPSGYWYIFLKPLAKILALIALNPIASVLIGMGLAKLKKIMVAKYLLLLAKLGAFWGPVVQGVIVFVGAALGLPAIKNLACALWDCIWQRKKGIEFKFKKTWFGIPYRLDFYAK